MANFANLKAAINAVIKANGQREITGEVMNQVLTAMVNSLGSNYQFAGVATPSTNPGTPDQNVFYMATQAGTYTNFSAIVLQAGITILLWNGSWSSETFFTFDSVPTSGSNNLITSGAVFDKLKLDGGAYDVTAHNDNATFADLSALLNSENLNTLIPVAVRHGGMSIKFVQTSDNKYVQFRYMGTSTAAADFTNTANWQADDINNRLIRLADINESQQSLSVGDYYYNPRQKQLRKVTGNSTYDVIPFVSGAVYSLLGRIFTWNGTDLILSEDFINVNDLNGKTDAYSNDGAARGAVKQGFRKQGIIITYLVSDGWHIEQFIGDDIEDWAVAGNWKSLLPIKTETDANTGDTSILAGESKVGAVASADKLIKLVGMGTLGAGTTGVTAIGDVYYNVSSKKLYRAKSIHDPLISGDFNEVTFYDGAIYTYNNELYIWNGTDLVSVDAVNAAFRIKVTKNIKESQTVFDSVSLELGGINNNGVENTLTNRARTAFIRAPFEIQLNSNYQIAVIQKYTISPDGTLSVETSTSSNISSYKAEKGVYRLVFNKSNQADISESDLAGIVTSFKGTLNIDESNIDKIYNGNLNGSALWELGYYNGSGNKADSNARVRTKDRIDAYVDYIKVATGVQYYLIGWNASGTFVKYWDGGKFQDTGTLLSGDIDLATIKAQNQGYTFAIFGVSDNVADYSSQFVFLNAIYKTNVNIDELKDEEYNKESLWVRAYINSSGNFVSSTNRIATKNFIDESVDEVSMTCVYPYYPLAFLVAYGKDGTYKGIVQSNDLSIGSSASEFEITIPLRTIRQKHPDCLFRIVVHRNDNTDIDISYSEECKFRNLIQARMDRIEYNKPMITFIDDDGMSEQFDNWKLIYDACGICPTMALVTVGLTQEDIDKVKQYGGLGFEFVSHSHGHSDLTTRTEEQLIADFRATTAALRDLGIKTANPSILVYPYNHVNDLVESVARDYFQCGIEGGEHRVNGKPLDRFHIRRESMLSTTRRKEVVIGGETVEVAIPKNLEEWKPFIDDLVAKNGWLVIMSHFRNSYAEDHYYFDESYIQPVVDLCKYAISRGCEILTAGEAFEKFKNKLEIGKVTDEHHYIVDCNSKVYDTME